MPDKFDYQPGNGSRYELYIIPTNPNHENKFQSFYFAWMRYGGSSGIVAKFNYDDFLHYNYFEEKMLCKDLHISTADTAALLCFLRQETGIRVGLPVGFDQNGLYVGTTRTDIHPMVD